MGRMPRVYSIDGVTPVVDASAFVHPSAVLIGDVIIGPRVYVGPAACLRGDFGRIIVEAGANVQDTCVLHGYPGKDLVVEEDGHVGHGAVLHGCRIGRNALVGMNAVINDNAVIGEGSIVSILSFVRAEMVVPPRTLVAGMPAKVVRELTDVELEWKASGTRMYQALAARSLATMVECEALGAPEPDRKRVNAPAALPLSEIKKAMGLR